MTSTDWATLRDAYGPAEAVPALLTAAEASSTSSGDAWDDVWSRLCHQGTVYPASFAAIPILTEMAMRAGAGGYVPALHLAAAIIASTDGPIERLDARERYAVELDQLRRMAEQGLALAADDTEFIYGLEALMAFEDGGVWQRNLNHVADGELPLECPSCGDFCLLEWEGPNFFLKGPTDASATPTPIAACEPPIVSVEGRLLGLARAHGRTALAETLRVVFGGAVCPNCHAGFTVPTALF